VSSAAPCFRLKGGNYWLWLSDGRPKGLRLPVQQVELRRPTQMGTDIPAGSNIVTNGFPNRSSPAALDVAIQLLDEPRLERGLGAIERQGLTCLRQGYGGQPSPAE
jgi:hypothetical protein